MWNLLNGLNLQKLEPVTLSDVTGIICLHDNQLLAVGWSQQVAQYDIKGAKVRKHLAKHTLSFSIKSYCAPARINMYIALSGEESTTPQPQCYLSLSCLLHVVTLIANQPSLQENFQE